MRIGDAAAAVGATPRALRYYEERGLVTAARSPSGHREYGAAHLHRLRTVRGLLDAGLTVEDVSEILTAAPGSPRPGSDCVAVREVVERRLDDLSRRIGRLAELRDRLAGRYEDRFEEVFRPQAGGAPDETPRRAPDPAPAPAVRA